MKVIINSK